MKELLNFDYLVLMPSMYAVLFIVVVAFFNLFSDEKSDIRKWTFKYLFEFSLFIYVLDFVLISIFKTPWLSMSVFFTEWRTISAFFTQWPWFNTFFTKWQSVNYLIDNFSEKLILSFIVITIYLLYMSNKLKREREYRKSKKRR